jgi:hypothetical protein
VVHGSTMLTLASARAAPRQVSCVPSHTLRRDASRRS